MSEISPPPHPNNLPSHLQDVDAAISACLAYGDVEGAKKIISDYLIPDSSFMVYASQPIHDHIYDTEQLDAPLDAMTAVLNDELIALERFGHGVTLLAWHARQQNS